MKEIIKTAILASIILFCISCANKKSEEITEQLTQDSNFWVVFDDEQAQKTDNKLAWDYNLDRPGKYNVQIICDGERDRFPSDVILETGGVLFTDAPEKIVVINTEGRKQTVFQFSKNVVFNESGLQTLELETSSEYNSVRILPDYKTTLGFGSEQYKSDWEAMHNSPEKQVALNWFKDAKYGMFIHWGLYSQAGGIWKEERMEDSENIGPKVSEWLMFKFQIPRDEYAELAKTFNPDKSFAKNIAKLAKDAGMKYLVITSKHHDGFALFDSKHSEFDMVDATPYKADAVKELYAACLEEGIGFGVYYSHGNDWYNGTDGNYANVKKANDSLGIRSHHLGKNTWDPSPNMHAAYIENKALPQIKELLQLLPKLRLVWFDGDGYITEAQSFKFYKTMFDINPNVLVSRRVGFDFGDYLDAGDNVIPSEGEKLTKYWETVGTTNNSWAYKSYDDDFKSTQEMLYYLVDIASKGGNYLLNIGPDGKGHVPEESANGLREIGAWLKVNGDAIYGTNAWTVAREGQDETLLEGTAHRAEKGFSRTFSEEDFWFTAKGNKVYVISFVNSETEVNIKSLSLENGVVEHVSVLGNASEIHWEQNTTGLKVELEGAETGDFGYVLEVILKEKD